MSLKFIICLLLFIRITNSSLSDWEKFKKDYNKQYGSITEENERKEIFLENLNRIKEFHETYPDATFTVGINHLIDRRIEEIVSNPESFHTIHLTNIEKSIESKLNIPDELDWRKEGVITPIEDQGQQAIEPAIAAVEVIESYQAIQTKVLQRGSLKQVMDCCPETFDILDCILNKMNGILCKSNEFNSTTSACDTTTCQPFARFNKIKKLSSIDEDTMLTWIQDSPLFIGVAANTASFQTYQEGIFSDTSCSTTEINHAMQLVGYGTRSSVPYWICKNSWGSNWGDHGYILIERNKNICGIARSVVQIEYKTNTAIVQSNPSNYIYLIFFSILFLI